MLIIDIILGMGICISSPSLLINWDTWLIKNPSYYEMPLIGRDDKVVYVKPRSNLTIHEIEKQLGKSICIRQVIKRIDDSERLLVMSISIYRNTVFLQSSMSARPGTIELILIIEN